MDEPEGYNYDALIEMCDEAIDTYKARVDEHALKGTLFTSEASGDVDALRVASSNKWSFLQIKFHLTGTMRMNAFLREGE